MRAKKSGPHVTEACGPNRSITPVEPIIPSGVKQTAPTLRQRVNEALFCDGLRLRGNNLVKLYCDGPLPVLYRPGHEPIYKASVDLETIAKSLGVLA
jgi:hypothetical protein